MGSVFQFTADVTDLPTKPVKSSPITLNNLKWNVILSKSEDENWVQVHLESTSNLSYWTCMVQASLKLLPKEDIEDEAIIASWKNVKFSHVNITYSNPQFIGWDDFINNYVNEDLEATFEIELSTSLLNCKKPSDINQIYTRLHITLENVGKIQEIVSSEMIVRGVRCRVRFVKKENILNATLIANETDIETYLSYNVSGIFKLLSFDGSTEPSVLNFTHYYRRGSSQVEKTLLDLTILENGTSPYVEDNRANVLVEFKVDKPKSLWANEVNSLNIVETTTATEATDTVTESTVPPS